MCITVDVEFNIAGALTYPFSRQPVGEEFVTCPVGGRENGLGFLLDCFSEHRIQATFFVEALNTTYFGDAVMGRIVDRILAAGQDVQLHLHPCWLYFGHPDWQSRLAIEKPNDNCSGRSRSEMAAIIETGLKTFRIWSISAPVALRTAGARADEMVYDAMHAVGLPLASHRSIHADGDPLLIPNGGRRWIRRVLEVPILTYAQLVLGRPYLHHFLTITGTSWRGLESLLWQARFHCISPVVILTHPFEFVKGPLTGFPQLISNRVNQTRLRTLCRFIAENSADFASTDFSGAAAGWLAEGEQRCPTLRVPVRAALGRIFTNIMNDTISFV